MSSNCTLAALVVQITLLTRHAMTYQAQQYLRLSTCNCRNSTMKVHDYRPGSFQQTDAHIRTIADS
jgi:hypothetical protein